LRSAFWGIRMKSMVLLSVLIFLLSSCSLVDRNVTPGPYDRPAPAKPKAEPVPVVLPDISGGRIPSFKEVQDSVLGPACYQCHTEATGNRGGVNLETLQNIRDETEKIFLSVGFDTMPSRRPPLSEAEKQVLFTWLDAGAPENEIQPKKPSPAE